MSNPESKQYNTIFMGPLPHRETRLDSYLNAHKDVKWSEEAENEYMENVKARASEKVRALLLQAKRRSDEIIHEAEQKAQEITAQAQQNSHAIEQNAQNILAQAEQRYQDTYQEAVQKGHEEIQQILIQNQQALGESTAIVLLTIHEQIAKLYETWKEDLKQLTLDAIEVGTGWIATSEKEAILKQLLDESVQKLLDKKNFIVRVNPADAELITQVLENSREKGWNMESSKELEPGSLELESDNVYVKNSRSERLKFVQEILNNLVLPQNSDEEQILQNVKNTLDHEMQHNPVLAHAINQNEDNSQPPLNVIPLETIMPKQENAANNTIPTSDTIQPQLLADEQSVQNSDTIQPQLLADEQSVQNQEFSVSDVNTVTAPLNMAETISPDQTAMPVQEISADMTDMPNSIFEQISPDMFDSMPASSVQEQTISDSPDNPIHPEHHTNISGEILSAEQNDINAHDDIFETLQAQHMQEQNQEIQQNSSPDQQTIPMSPQGLTEIIEELPSFNTPKNQTNHSQDQLHTEAADMVEEFLGSPKKDETALPNNVADDLLAEMGFNQK